MRMSGNGWLYGQLWFVVQIHNIRGSSKNTVDKDIIRLISRLDEEICDHRSPGSNCFSLFCTVVKTNLDVNVFVQVVVDLH